MKMKGSRIVVESLLKENVDTIFCYIGGAVIPIFDALYQYGSKLNLIQPRHEQAGTHAADGYARSTGKTGVCIVTSGPGATNTITGIATAFIDSIPMVVITGQVPSYNIGTDAFQESDITGITIPITKANFLIKSADEIAPTLKKAFHIAGTGRQGPVLVDIPVDFQSMECSFDYPEKVEIDSYNPRITGHPRQIKSALDLIGEAKKPLIISGGGVINSNSTGQLNEFVRKHQIPVVNTLMGFGTDAGKKLSLGGLGMHGTLYGNYAVMNCDLLIALGTRFSDRILGDKDQFAPHAKVIHVDVDPAEIGKNKDVDVPIVGSLDQVLKEFNKAELSVDFSHWVKEICDFKSNNPLQFDATSGLKPQLVISAANDVFGDNTIVVTDVGQNQMWVPQFFNLKNPRCHLSSGGLGTMGYALPAAIGAKIGNPSKEVLMFAGDGGFQMNIQELATIKKYELNLKMIILDNQYLGMVRQWQQLLCDRRYSETNMSDNPNFVAIANAFGIKAKKIELATKVRDAVVGLKESREPMILQVMIDREENVLPMVPAGRPYEERILEI
jgi:acetolactate synthase-1/2/3 large subunit